MEKTGKAQKAKFVDFEDLMRYINELPLEQRVKIVQRLLGNHPDAIITDDIMSNSNVLQINCSPEEISQQLSNRSAEVVAKLLEAIAIRIENKNR